MNKNTSRADREKKNHGLILKIREINATLHSKSSLFLKFTENTHTSGLFCPNMPTNCSGFGWQPLASSPEPRSCAFFATWGVGDTQSTSSRKRNMWRTFWCLKHARPLCRRSTRMAALAAWSQDTGHLLNNSRHECHVVAKLITGVSIEKCKTTKTEWYIHRIIKLNKTDSTNSNHSSTETIHN